MDAVRHPHLRETELVLATELLVVLLGPGDGGEGGEGGEGRGAVSSRSYRTADNNS